MTNSYSSNNHLFLPPFSLIKSMPFPKQNLANMQLWSCLTLLLALLLAWLVLSVTILQGSKPLRGPKSQSQLVQNWPASKFMSTLKFIQFPRGLILITKTLLLHILANLVWLHVSWNLLAFFQYHESLCKMFWGLRVLLRVCSY